MGPGSGQPAGLELRQIVALLAKWRWLIVVVTGVCLATSAFLSFFVLPKVYEASATLDVSYAALDQGQGSANASQSLQGVIQSVATLPQNTMETYQWQVTNPVVLQGTSRALAAQGIQESAGQIASMVKTANVADTNLVTVSVADTSPTVAAAVANTLTKVYLATIQAQDHGKLTQAVGFLQGQANSVATRLHAATANLTKAASAAGPAASSQLQASEQQLQGLQGQLTQAQVQLRSGQAGVTALEQQLRGVPATVSSSVTPLRSVRPNPVYQALAQEAGTDAVTVAQDRAVVSALQGAVAAAALTVRHDTAAPGRASSTLQAAEQNLEGLQAQLTQAEVQRQSAEAGQAAVAQQMKGLAATETVTTLPATGTGHGVTVETNPTYQTLTAQLATDRVAVAQDEATVSALQAAEGTLRGQVSALAASTQGDQANVQALQSQVQELTDTYQTLMQNLTQAQVADAMSLGSTVVTLAAPAGVPGVPVKPDKKLDLALALVLGLLVSVGLAFLVEQLDNTVKTAEDLERWADVPTLAVIPHFGG